MSGYRCVSDCRSRGREFDPGPVPYFRGDWSWNNFYGHSPPFRWFIREGLLSVTSESMCTNYWLTACSSLPRKKYGKCTDRPAMTIAVDLGRKAPKQTNKLTSRPIQFNRKKWCFHYFLPKIYAEFLKSFKLLPIQSTECFARWLWFCWNIRKLDFDHVLSYRKACNNQTWVKVFRIIVSFKMLN